MANPPQSGRPRLPWPEWTLYIGLTFLFLVPQSLSPATRIAYVGDSLESAAIVGFVGHQIVRDPRHIFDAGFLHPTPNALTLTDHRLLPSILAAPVLWISKNPVLAYNAALLFAYVLAAFGGRRLALTLGLGRSPRDSRARSSRSTRTPSTRRPDSTSSAWDSFPSRSRNWFAGSMRRKPARTGASPDSFSSRDCPPTTTFSTASCCRRS